MRFDFVIGAAAFLAAGLGPAAAQSRTLFSESSRRMTSDVCANIDGPFEVQGPAATDPVVNFGNIHMCTCVSKIHTLLETDPVVKAAVQRFGAPAAATALEDMITEAAEGVTCWYPEGTIPVCDANDACAYTCGNGFTVSHKSKECVCEEPKSVCGDKCTLWCPSPSAVWPGHHTTRAVAARDRVALRRRMCPRDYTVCGVFEKRGRMGEPWECVDTRHELESCGGCMQPFDASSPRGVDCTAIPGVADVSCRDGSCVVSRCMSGYAVTEDRTGCVESRRRAH